MMSRGIKASLFVPFCKQDKRKHRGPSNKITPKSREFIETDSSSSSSECHSDSEGALKIPAPLPPPAPPPQEKRSAINTQTLSNTNAPPLPPCPGSAGSLGTPFGSKGLRVKDGGGVTADGSGGINGTACNALSVGNGTGSFGASVPDPGGLGGQRKDPVPVSPPPNVGHEVPPSPLRDFQEIQSLWVKVELSLLGRVPGQGSGERSRSGQQAERDGSAGRDRERQGERTGAAERERQKQAERERERQRTPKGEKPEEENERLAPDRERQGDRDPLTERERPTDREDRDGSGVGERDRTAGKDREKAGQGPGAPDNPAAQEQSHPRLAGRTEGKHRRQAAGSVAGPTEKHGNKSKRKHKVVAPPLPHCVAHSCFTDRCPFSPECQHCSHAVCVPCPAFQSDHSESSAIGNKKLRLDKDCQLLPPFISPTHNHRNGSAE